MGKRGGCVSSKMHSCPPGLSTRHISESPRSRSAKLRMPKAAVTASKVLSANDRFRQSSLAKVMMLLSAAASAFRRPISIIPSLISAPTSR